MNVNIYKKSVDGWLWVFYGNDLVTNTILNMTNRKMSESDAVRFVIVKLSEGSSLEQVSIY